MWREVLASLVLMGPLGATAMPQPEAGWWTTTTMDADRDGLDDLLEPLLVGSAPITVLVAYARMPTPAQQAALEARGAVVTFAPHHFPLLVARAPADRVASLLDAPGVVLVEKNDEIRPLLKESVPLTGAPQAWQKYATTGKGIVIAVLDDGAFEQHPDLQPKLAGHFDASMPNTPIPRPGGFEPLAPAGEEGHGTHVAGTIVGGGQQSSGVYKGVAPDARFVNVKVFSAPNQTNSDIVIRGLDWVLDNADAMGIRVASLSLGGRASDGKDALSRAVDVAVDKGMIVVAAVGNAGPNAKTVTSPGAAAKAITVGAVDKQKRVAGFSSRGPTLDGRVKPDIMAPGVNIVSTVPPASTGTFNGFLSGGRSAFYGPLSGSSMATPHVSGAVALMLQANPGLTPFEVKQILLVTAQDLGAAGSDNDTGYGFMNAVAAVQVSKDPSLLARPEFRSRLATIPEPEPESVLERLSFEAQGLMRSGNLLLYVAATVGALALVAIVVVLVRK